MITDTNTNAAIFTDVLGKQRMKTETRNFYCPDKLHVMLDLETLSTQPNAVILSIGAQLVSFPLDGFYRKIRQVENAAFHVCIETLSWWNKQDKVARDEAFSGMIELPRALESFALWFPHDAIIWSSGADFDIPILKYALNYYGIPVPWQYKNVGCYRTLNQLLNIDWDKEAEIDKKLATQQKHIAILDAKVQANRLDFMLKRVNSIFSNIERNYNGTSN